MSVNKLNFDDAEIHGIQSAMQFSVDTKNKVARQSALFKGINFTSGTGTSAAAVTDIDWNPDKLHEHTSSRAFPKALSDDDLQKLLLAGPILYIAATHAITLPVTHAELCDVLLVHFCNTIGFSAREYIVGQTLLKAQYKTPCVTRYTAYEYSGYSTFVSKIRPDFMSKLRSGNYQKFDDLFSIYTIQESDQLAVKSTPNNPASEQSPKPTSILAAREEQLTIIGPDIKITQQEQELIERIKQYYSANQLTAVGVAFAYLLIRLVAKSSDHAIDKGKSFAVLPNKYGLDMNPSISFNFTADAVETIRTNITGYASTVATYLQSVIEYITVHEDAVKVPELCKIQIKAMIEIRLAFYGMVLPALGLSVADKLRITGENLAYISVCDLTQRGCSVFLDFLSRLDHQAPDYKKERGLEHASKIDPNGPFRFCRLFNQQYMMDLSGIRHMHTTYLWMYIQRNLVGPTTARSIKDSDKIFARLSEDHMDFLAALGDLIINFHSGSAGLTIAEGIDSEAAKIIKRKLLEKRKAPIEKFTALVSSGVSQATPTVSLQAPAPAPISSFDLAAFKGLSSK